MPTTIEVNKQSVEALLGSGKSKPFVIPEYQRPYAWTDEQVETLFEDLWEFTATSGGTEREGSYFLGSVVSYENENGEQEIIDGQQRITSLFLLRCIEIGIQISELDLLTVGLVLDIWTEKNNDGVKYRRMATQEDFDRF